MQVNAITEEFDHIELFGKPVLLTNARVDKATVPKGWYRYNIRGSDRDPGSLCTLEREVAVNHAATILSPEEIPLSKGKEYRPIRGSQNFLGETMTIAEFCACHGLPIPENPQKYLVRPASPEEAGLFYVQTPEQDETLGAIGHVRIDFGHGGKEFWHTWHPRGAEELNSSDFKAELSEVIGQLWESVLHDLSSMRSYTLTAAVTDELGRGYTASTDITVYPVADISFSLPETIHTDTAVPIDLNTEHLDGAEISWSVTLNGETVSLSDAVGGELSASGGTVRFMQSGSYTLTAAAEDALGKIVSCRQTVRVYPVVGISIDLLDIAHTDETITLSVDTENLNGPPIVWTGTLDGNEIDPGGYLCGGYHDRGQLFANRPGTYTLTAHITDETGREYSATDTMTCYPVGSVGFFLPTAFHTDETVLVEAEIAELAGSGLVWTLTRNGEAVSLAKYVDGVLTETGGTIRVNEKGSYTLSASYTDGGGRAYRYDQSFTDYPIPTVNFSLPATAWTDTEIEVTVESADTEDVTVKWLVDNTYGYQDWNTFVSGRLAGDGGTIRFKRAGTYELVAQITDATGRVFLFEQGAKCEVQPVLELKIEMPELFRVDRTVDIRTSGNNNILPVDWSLTKDGQEVELWDCYEVTLNAYGGKGNFLTHGDYVLTASMTDVLGRTFSTSRSILVYPIVTYAVSIPDSCHIGTAFAVTAEGEYLDDCTVTWTLSKDGEAAEYAGVLDESGGEIAILETGSYTLTASVAGPYGNVYTAEDSIEITNTAPTVPVITIEMDYFDTLNTYTPDCQIKVNISASSADADGDSFELEYAEGSEHSGYFGVGTYTVKIRGVDQWGLASDWAEQTFVISGDDPDVDLYSALLGSNDGTNTEELDFALEISRSGRNQIAVADYHNPSQLESISTLSVSEDGSTIHGWFAFGRHILLVKVTDIFGNTAYGARAFIVSNEENEDKTSITTLSTTITEEGLYDGTDLLAYIGGFTFNIPAISGHSTGCQDLIEIFGVTEDGTQELVLTFNTNNGYVYAHSGGVYEYTADRKNTLATGEWSGWDPQKYTKMVFHYEMTAGHESCIANATEGLSYRVRYSFIPEQIEKIEALFSQVE